MESVHSQSPADVALLITNMECGGAERVAVNLLNSWVRMGLNVELLLLDARGPFLADLHESVRVVDLKLNNVVLLPFALIKHIRANKPKSLLACMWPLTVIAVLAKLLSGVNTRVVVAEHTTWSVTKFYNSPVRRFVLRLSMRLLYPFAAHILTVSEGAADDLSQVSLLSRSKILKIYNPVVNDIFQIETVTCDSLGLQWMLGEHLKILAVGNLKKIKDFSNLIRAFSIVRKALDVRLLILGEGDCRVELENLALDLGVSEYIEMPGFVADTSKYFKEADLFVLSSIGEGLPTVIIEALHYGTPVVSTDCPSGPREILDDGKFGALVPVANAESLADGMIESLSSEHDKALLASRASIFSIDRISKQYLNLLLPT